MKRFLLLIAILINRLYVFFIQIITFKHIDNNKVFLVSYSGKSLGDNPGAVFNYLRNKNDYTFVFAYNYDNGLKDKNVIFVKYRTLFNFRFYYHLFTSKVIINNSRFNFDIKKRNNQLYIQTWHGGGAQKKAEGDSIQSLSKKYIKNAIQDSKYIDLFLSDSNFMSSVYSKSYWYNGPILETGYPRYDNLLNTNSSMDLKKSVFDYFKIDSDTKLLLYAPTFRNDFSLDYYDVDFNEIIKSLENKYKTKILLLIKLHPNMSKLHFVPNCNKQWLDVTNYFDSQALLCASDFLISDYSSISFDFCLMKKPVIRYASDLHKYEKERSFYFDFKEYPFPFAKTNAELVKIIEEFDYKKYLYDLESFFSKIGQKFYLDSTIIVSSIVSDYLSGLTKEEIIQKNECYLYKK